jgi:hypothetical protein
MARQNTESAGKKTLAFLGVIAIIVSLPFLWVSWTQCDELQHSKPEATDMAASYLASQGPGANWHIRLNNFTVDNVHVVHKENDHHVECDLVPSETPTPPYKKIRLQKIIKMEEGASTVSGLESVEGFVKPTSGSEYTFEIKAVPKPDDVFAQAFFSAFALVAGIGMTIASGRMK